MKNTAVFALILPMIVLSLMPAVRSSTVRADGSDMPQSQEAARDSVASCDNKTYRVPSLPEGAAAEEHFALPPNADGPVLADLGLSIEEIPEINEIDNTFTIEGVMDIVWCDPRLKYEDKGQGAFEIFLEGDAQEKLDAIWWPDVGFANETSARDIANQELVIHENGTVNYHEKFTVILEATYDLLKFPFDMQKLEIEIESFAWDEKYLQLHIEENAVGLSTEFHLPEWRTGNITTSVEDVQEVGDREPFSEFLMVIDVARQSGFYIWKVLFPLVILVIMCFAVFWMEDEDLSSRLGVSFTGVLTVVAYQFIATGSLPKVPYITLIDTYISISFVIMVLAIVQSLVVNIYNKSDRREIALRIDRVSRIAFPLAYLLGIAGLTMLFLLPG